MRQRLFAGLDMWREWIASTAQQALYWEVPGYRREQGWSNRVRLFCHSPI